MDIYFEPTFEELNPKYMALLNDDKFSLYNVLYPFELINMYRTILIIENGVGTVYVNPDNTDTVRIAELLSYDSYGECCLLNSVDAIITDGKILKNRFGKNNVTKYRAEIYSNNGTLVDSFEGESATLVKKYSVYLPKKFGTN